MNYKWIISLLSLSLLSAQAKEVYDTVIMSGQSNMRGKGQWAERKDAGHAIENAKNYLYASVGPNTPSIKNGFDKPAGKAQSIPGFYTISSRGTSEKGGYGPEYAFAKNYYDHKAGSGNLAIIKGAVGGTTIEKWLPKATRKNGEAYGFYDALLNEVKDLITNLEAAGHSYNVLGFVWLQGESNRNHKRESDYYSELNVLMSNLQTDLSAFSNQFDQMNTYLIQPSFWYKKDENGNKVLSPRSTVTEVDDAMIKYAKQKTNATFIKTSDIGVEHYSDGVHFNAHAQEIIGTRLYKVVFAPKPKSEGVSQPINKGKPNKEK